MKKTNDMVKIYSLFTQGIFTILILGGLGFYIGYIIDKSGILKGVLAAVGVLIGIIIFIKYMLQIGGEIDG